MISGMVGSYKDDKGLFSGLGSIGKLFKNLVSSYLPFAFIGTLGGALTKTGLMMVYLQLELYSLVLQ